MAEKAEPEQAEECKCETGAPKWVVTFGDMMSLLVCFFVLIVSFSTTDIIKYRQMAGSVKDAFGMAKTTPRHNNPMADKIIATQLIMPKTFAALVAVRSKAMRLAKSSSELEMESGADWVRIKIDGDALFTSGGFDIRDEAKPLLDEIGTMINDFEGSVFIEGHTDNQPLTTSRFGENSYLGNYELGALRSISVLGYLIGNVSVDPAKLVPTTFGQTKPRETNDFVAGQGRNRRVEFEFRTSNKKDSGEVDGRYVTPNNQ